MPFDFIVHDTTLPKGEYIVSTDSDGFRLLIQNQREPQYITLTTSTMPWMLLNWLQSGN